MKFFNEFNMAKMLFLPDIFGNFAASSAIRLGKLPWQICIK
jgi:hypothetical protein